MYKRQPLDTAVGGERTTVQLLDIRKDGDTYSFDFSKLERWIGICRFAGITHFEMAHLFTQWGAKCAPKIMVWEDGTLRHKFGWHTDAQLSLIHILIFCRVMDRR